MSLVFAIAARGPAPESSFQARNVIDAQPAAGETAGRITRS